MEGNPNSANNMALSLYDQTKSVVAKAKDSAPQKKSQPKRYPINYEKLKELLAIPGLKQEKDVASTQAAHRLFMEKYRHIFIVPERSKLPSIAVVAQEDSSIHSNRSDGPTEAKTSSSQTDIEEIESKSIDSHDIRIYTKVIKRQKHSDLELSVKTDGGKVLRKLLRKMPFQRTSEDITFIYKAMKTFPSFSNMFSNAVLKELAYVAQLDSWKEGNFPVFGSSGMHLILKGSVVSLNPVYIFHPSTSLQDFKRTSAKYSAEESTSQVELVVGECFGTLTAIDGQTMHKNLLMVNTNEQNCEFLKITTTDYSRVIEQMKNKEQTKKLNLLQACSPFKMWTRQPKLKVSGLISWQTFAPNTVVVSEGYRAPFIGFILSGECHVLKQLDVLQAEPNGNKVKATKQVVFGKMGPNQSFAELSILNEEPMKYTIITATETTLGTISPVDLFSLDQTTLDLLQQSCQANTDQSITQEKIQQEYMEQEQKREWNQYKHNAVIEAINAQGIRPGYGKWSKH